MNLVQTLENQTKVLRAKEVARLFDVTPQHIYKMAAAGTIPSMRIAKAIRFDSQELATWIRKSSVTLSLGRREGVRRRVI